MRFRTLLAVIAVMALALLTVAVVPASAKKPDKPGNGNGGDPTGSLVEPAQVALVTGPDACGIHVTYGLEGSGKRQVEFDFVEPAPDGSEYPLALAPADGIVAVKSRTTRVTGRAGPGIPPGEGLDYTGTPREVEVLWTFVLSYSEGKKNPVTVVLETETGSATVSVPTTSAGTCTVTVD